MNCVKLHEEGSLAVSGSVDGTARIWDLRSRSYEPIQERINFVMRRKWGASVFDRYPAPCGIRALDGHRGGASQFNVQSIPLERSSPMHETQSRLVK